jgi:hypothetical protein
MSLMQPPAGVHASRGGDVIASAPLLTRRAFYLLAGLIFVLAWSLRLQFVLTTHVDSPFDGDCRFYVAYAYNMVFHGIYSGVLPGSGGAVVPDDFRGPGYSLFLAAMMRAAGATGDWYRATLVVQATLGALTVLIGMRLAREWLPRAGVLVAGLLMAVWPHLIAASGALLSEVVYGFVVSLALLAFSLGLRTNRRGWMAASGVAFGYAYLTNQVIFLLPFVLALLMRRRGWRLVLALVAFPLLFAAAWFARSTSLPDQPGGGRLAINLVQGAEPYYLDAWKFSQVDQGARQLVAVVEAEAAKFATRPGEVLHRIWTRIAEQPLGYARWYLVEKPWLLWDWNIRVGAADIYVMSLTDPSLERTPIVRAMVRACRDLNLPIFLVSGLTAFVLGWRALGKAGERPDVAVAVLCIYVTAVHAILQSEPRYSIPYRPFEFMLFVTGIWLAWRAVQARVTRGAGAP